MSITIRYDFRIAAAMFIALSAGACTTVDPTAMAALEPTADAPAARTEIASGPAVSAPIGFLDFCRRSPVDCGAADAEAATVVARESGARYWQTVFNPTGAEQAVPASLSRPAAVGRYDWSGVFGLAPAQPAEPEAPAVLASHVLLHEAAVGASDSGLAAVALASADEPAPTPAVVLVDKDSDQWKAVNAANRLVNRSIRRGSDDAVHGTPDYWEAGLGGRGDCEDYVLTKRRVLIERGIPAEALSIALVRTRWGEDHAVLLVATPDGEYVLDNLTPWIERWDAVDYDWRQRQLPGEVFNWINLAA